MTSTTPWYALFRAGQRTKLRRSTEYLKQCIFDRYGIRTFVLVLLLLMLSIADAVITLHLLDVGCQEINPVMSYLLGRGLLPFLLGKYLLTATGLPILLLFKNYFLFGTRFRVGFLLPLFVGLYLLLIGYQFHLLGSQVGSLCIPNSS